MEESCTYSGTNCFYSQQHSNFPHFYSDLNHHFPIEGISYWIQHENSVENLSQSSAPEADLSFELNTTTPRRKSEGDWPPTESFGPRRCPTTSIRRKGVGGRRKSEKPPSPNLIKKRRVAANAR